MDTRSTAIVEKVYREKRGLFINFCKKYINFKNLHQFIDYNDVINQAFLHILKSDLDFESENHAVSVIVKNIRWVYIEYLRKTISDEHKIKGLVNSYNDELPGHLSYISDHYPLTKEIYHRIDRLHPTNLKAVKLYLHGFHLGEVSKITGKPTDDCGNNLLRAIKYIGDGTKSRRSTSPMDYLKRHAVDGKTEEILKLKEKGLSDTQIGNIVGLTRTQVKGRRAAYRKTLKKQEIYENNN